jgi:hypothetical protein
VAVEVVDHPQAQVRQRTKGERNPLAGEALDEGGVVESVIAVVDAGHVEQIERVAHVTKP